MMTVGRGSISVGAVGVPIGTVFDNLDFVEVVFGVISLNRLFEGQR